MIFQFKIGKSLHSAIPKVESLFFPLLSSCGYFIGTEYHDFILSSHFSGSTTNKFKEFLIRAIKLKADDIPKEDKGLLKELAVERWKPIDISEFFINRIDIRNLKRYV